MHAGVAYNLSIARLEQIIAKVAVARWLFWRPDQLKDLNDWVVEKNPNASVFNLSFYLSPDLERTLPTHLQPKEVIQHAGELIVVPIGCAHQV